MREEDLEKCLNIVRELKEWFLESALKEIRRDLKAKGGYVSLRNGDVVGFIVVDERPCCLEISWMAVDRRMHGKGVGTELLKAVEELACEKGKLVTVKTYGGEDYEPYNLTRRFYESRGFRLYEVIDPYPPWGQPAAVYVKIPSCIFQ